MRVCIPSKWLTNVSLSTQRLHAGEQRLDTVLKEEKAWADTANSKRMMSLAFSAACVAVCVAVLVWAIVMFFRHGKEHKPDFTEQYWRDVPRRGVHPAVIGRLWRWNRESTDDLTATIMHLAQTGAVRIDSGSYMVPKKHGGTKTVNDFYITKLVEVDAVSDPIDKATFNLLFDRVASGQNSLWFGSIKKYGEDHSEQLVNAVKNWQGVLTAETDKHGFFEEKGNNLRGWTWTIAVALFVIAMVIWFMSDNMMPMMCAVPTAAALAFIGNNMTRRSIDGNNLVAYCKALRNWLRDFSSLEERPPTDVKVWGEFMVYAYLFGVAKQAIEQLRKTQPQLFQVDQTYGDTYVPWWGWYTSYESGANAGMPDVGSFLSSSFNQAVKTANEAIQAESSGSGSGGGFSSGGGGGFGGGGGGAR